MNLKKLLMELGNALVMNHGYDPATIKPVGGDPHKHFLKVVDSSTTMIYFITEWLNDPKYPERREELKKLGVEWPIVEKS